MAKKKQRRQSTDAAAEPELNPNNGNSDDTHNKKKLKKEKKTNEIPTVSIAVPASIIDNVPTLELATRVPISKWPFFLFLFHSLYSDYILFLFSLFSWLVKLLVPQLFFESMRLLMLLSTFSHVILIIIF